MRYWPPLSVTAAFAALDERVARRLDTDPGHHGTRGVPDHAGDAALREKQGGEEQDGAESTEPNPQRAPGTHERASNSTKR